MLKEGALEADEPMHPLKEEEALPSNIVEVEDRRGEALMRVVAAVGEHMLMST